jgi:hypothetical protein
MPTTRRITPREELGPENSRTLAKVHKAIMLSNAEFETESVKASAPRKSSTAKKSTAKSSAKK